MIFKKVGLLVLNRTQNTIKMTNQLKPNKFPKKKAENESITHHVAKSICAALTNNISVFGWDNVLFPKQAIYGGGLLRNIEIGDLDNNDQNALATLEIEVIILLNEVLKWSRKVAIVTYRNREYVEKTCREFMPKVWKLIEANEIEIIGTENAGNLSAPVSWKRDIFKSIIKQNRLPIVPYKFLCVGLGLQDSLAARGFDRRVLPSPRRGSRKIIFGESSSIEELKHRVKELNSNFSDYKPSRSERD